MAEQQGVIVRNKFVTPAEISSFSGYISYENKESGSRCATLKRYEMYEEYVAEYMADEKKATNLFTDNKDVLTKDDMKKYGDIFSLAQENGSMLWQIVISFTNPFLEENGLYRSEELWLDEKTLKTYIRNGVGRMLHSENLDHAVWVGSFHYNTDNIHAHIAVVEPMPIRRKKTYMRDGKLSEEIVGKFKVSSMKKCRSYITNAVKGDKNVNIEITNLIRKSIVGKKRETLLHREENYRHEFLTIYDQLPKQKNTWSYNHRNMDKLRPLIDDLSRRFMIEYQMEEFLKLKELLMYQNETYKGLYGRNSKKTDYMGNKTADLYSRLGNAILKEMKEYDDILQQQILEKRIPKEINYETIPEPDEIKKEFLEQYETDLDAIMEFPDEDVYMDWNEEYKKARESLYGTNQLRPDFEKAFRELTLEAENGNVLAMHDLGSMFYHGRGVEVNVDAANRYYERSLRGFQELQKSAPKKMQDYLKYRIAKMFYQGQGTEKNLDQTRMLLEGNRSPYAIYMLGLMYRNGEGVEKNLETAFDLCFEAARKGMPYASFEVGRMYEEGIGVDKDEELSEKHYKTAREKFERQLRRSPDDKLYNRVGKMYASGQGTEVDLEKAVQYYERAAYYGNIQAHINLVKLYVETNDIEHIQLVVPYLEKICLTNNSEAQYELGKIYLKSIPEIQDYEKGIEHLKKASDQGNEYAQYRLGKFYLTGAEEYRDIKQAEYYLTKAKEQGNISAQFLLGKLYQDHSSDFYNREKAIECFKPLAEKENADANLMLGIIYLQGDKRREEINMAKEYFKTAEKLGNKYARDFLKSIDTKSSCLLKQHNQHQITQILGALKRSLAKESQRAMNEYEFEQTLDQAVMIE